MIPDLQAENNQINRLFSKYSSEGKIAVIAMTALIAAMLSLLMSWMAIHDAIHVKIQLEVVLESNADLKKEIRLSQMKFDRQEAKLDTLTENINVP